jgi:hypothetical protein
MELFKKIIFKMLAYLAKPCQIILCGLLKIFFCNQVPKKFAVKVKEFPISRHTNHNCKHFSSATRVTKPLNDGPHSQA